MIDTLRRSSYSFPLSPEQVAQEPGPDRGGSRLLVLSRELGNISHHAFRDLPGLLQPGDLLVQNDTRVLTARVLLLRETGGGVPGLLLETPVVGGFQIMLEGSRKLREGDNLRIADVARRVVDPLRAAGGESAEAEAAEDQDPDVSASIRLEESLGGGVWRASVSDRSACEALLATGRMPLPPYIRRAKRGPDPRDDLDRERYQTVFAAHEGAVAAPTAGLHFTNELIAELSAGGVEVARVTLHVGPGTFMPVRVDDLREHQMHAERYSVSSEAAEAIAKARAEGRRIIAVGTTVVRTLEAAFDEERQAVVAGDGETALFIHPPYEFRAVDAMITNFHLPESTLLMLVAAFCGHEQLMDAYKAAVDSGYRFFSYGDAMFVDGPARSAG